ncbi:NYN domain-containing protein [Microbacterium thalli]|uniref:NYN domain-containing protein n=1 Tax=Microbacterium thalli TaxID=3027921 RepID=A0ABT5SG07_9MICO|nr:NYN domain-containing protein [Microbacterium thalli]MDD7961692.1 NYN domain-containing protein [Microbacterium thalli]
MPQQSDLLAVLVDADNVSPSRIGAVLAEIATYGTASVKRVYGDWTKTQLRGWKDAASEHVIQPMQQFDNTTGKNATDSALIIDAMDLLYTRRFQGFCIVSSDSDFTRLASRIREEGVTVYGFGERKTPEAFRNACDQFTYLEVLGAANEPDAARSTTPARWSSAALRGDARLASLLRSSVDTASADDGWADLGTVGQLMRKQQPDFDPRNWGYAKLSDLLKAVDLFTIESKPGGMSLRPRTGKGTKASEAPTTATGGEAETEAAAAPAPERTKRAPRKRGSARGGSASDTADAAPAGEAETAPATDASATDGDAVPAPSPAAEANAAESPAAESNAAESNANETDAAPTDAATDVAAGDAGESAAPAPAQRPRKKSTRSRATAPEPEQSPAAASEADTDGAGTEATDPDAVTEGAPAKRASARARGSRRPIEQLTLDQALDAALDAVSDAARRAGAGPAVDSAAAAPDAGAEPAQTEDEPQSVADAPTEDAAPARPKRAPRKRTPKAAASEPATAAAAEAAPATGAAAVVEQPAPAASDAGAAEAGATEAAGADAPAPARKRAPRRASRPGSAAD